MKDRCIKWAAEEIAERRPFVLLTAQELKDKYREIKGANPKSKWNAAELITEIIRPANENTNLRRSNTVMDPNLLDQELMNIVVRGLGLKPLEGEAKGICQKGHDMEPIYSQQLLDNHDFPWGTVEETSQVGLAQKDGMEFVKGSVDRVLGIRREDGINDLDLTEFKCRVSHNRVR